MIGLAAFFPDNIFDHTGSAKILQRIVKSRKVLVYYYCRKASFILFKVTALDWTIVGLFGGTIFQIRYVKITSFIIYTLVIVLKYEEKKIMK